MGIVVNLTANDNDNMTTVTVVTTWGYQVVSSTSTSTIEAITAAMRSVERRIAAKKEDIRGCRKPRKLPKWKHALEILRAAQRALGDRLIELTEAEVKAEGGKIWVNKWDGDVDPSGDVSVPQKWRDIRGGTSVRTWPIAQAGAIVTHNDRRWKVVVNEIHGGAGGYYVPVFSVYAVVPA